MSRYCHDCIYATQRNEIVECRNKFSDLQFVHPYETCSHFNNWDFDSIESSLNEIITGNNIYTDDIIIDNDYTLVKT